MLSVIIILEQIDIVNSVQVLLIISLYYYRRAIATCFTDWYCLQYVDSELLKASCIHFSLIIVHYYVLQNDSPSEKSQDIIAHLTSLLILQCQCNINMNTVITNGGFQCFANSPELVTYRAQLQGTLEVAALEFVQILQQWVSSGPSINIKAQILNVKSSCPVLIASFSDPECDSSTAITTLSHTVTDVVTDGETNSVMDGVSDGVTDSNTSAEVNLTTIIIISIVCATLITLVIAIVIIVYLRLRSSGSFMKKSIPNM